MPLTSPQNTNGVSPHRLALLPLGAALFLCAVAYATAFTANISDRADEWVGTDIPTFESYAFAPGGELASQADYDGTRYSLRESLCLRWCTAYFL